MEDVIGFVIAVLTVVVLLAVIVHFERRYPGKQKDKVIAALEEAERIGVSDITTDIKATAHRWYLLREASRRPAAYKVTDYKERIDAQLKVLEPHNDTLRKYMGRGAGIDWGHISSI